MTEKLNVVDDTGDETLTVSDIRELKRLANASRAVRWLWFLAAGIITVVGFDHVVEIFKR